MKCRVTGKGISRSMVMSLGRASGYKQWLSEYTVVLDIEFKPDELILPQ